MHAGQAKPPLITRAIPLKATSRTSELIPIHAHWLWAKPLPTHGAFMTCMEMLENGLMIGTLLTFKDLIVIRKALHTHWTPTETIVTQGTRIT